jgi:hypothetical protein
MPVTPFHLGPALVIKAAMPRHFSLGAFTLVQGIIDVESVGNILLGRWPVHATLHTFVGAGAVAALVAVVGRPILAAAYRWPRGRTRSAWYRAQLDPPTWLAVAVGAGMGAVLHVVPDAMMHPDLQPLRPWSPRNPFLFDGAFALVHVVCLVLAIAGWFVWRRRSTPIEAARS